MIRRGLTTAEPVPWIEAAIALTDFARFSGHVTPSPLDLAGATSTALCATWHAARCIQSLGDIALARSEHEEAREQYERALPMYEQVGDVLGQANCIRSLENIARAEGAAHRAREHYQAALALYARIPEPYSLGHTHRLLAHLETDPAARRVHVDAARSFWLGIDRHDLVALLDQEFPAGPPAA
ncbi:tetratricopeptide repeat protein [Chondromyces apiculatus]